MDVLEAMQLRKSFPRRRAVVEAVRGVDLRVGRGEVFGFLGPNGAGKTTTVRMLATLLPFDGGSAVVAGADVRREPHLVRRRIGYVSQAGGADLPATGRENLLLQARLYGADRRAAERRAGELIDALALGGFVDRPARTYSGGQRRRLEVALGLMHEPDLLFLDEPTTGLDPHNRANLWDQLRALREGGTTILLTTHYLDEADALVDRLAIIDGGRIVAEGTPGELKQGVGAARLTLRPARDQAPITELRELVARMPHVQDAQIDGGELRLTISDGAHALPTLLSGLAARHVELESVAMAEPTLDDVFLSATGRALRDTGTEDAA